MHQNYSQARRGGGRCTGHGRRQTASLSQPLWRVHPKVLRALCSIRPLGKEMFVLGIDPYIFRVIVSKVFLFYERGKYGLPPENQGIITKELYSQRVTKTACIAMSWRMV